MGAARTARALGRDSDEALHAVAFVDSLLRDRLSERFHTALGRLRPLTRVSKLRNFCFGTVRNPGLASRSVQNFERRDHAALQ